MKTIKYLIACFLLWFKFFRTELVGDIFGSDAYKARWDWLQRWWTEGYKPKEPGLAKTISSWMKQKSKTCMKCNRPVRFWQRKSKLFPWDYCVWHRKCRPPKTIVPHYLSYKELGLRKIASFNYEYRWWQKVKCFLFGHWMAYAPDGSGDQFCERGCGK